MEKYFFYFKNNLEKEVISYYTCDNEKEAILFFSKQKKLKPETFLKIFNISKTDDYNSL